MILKVAINNFKKFGQLVFSLEDHLVIAGPNNSGKTTLCQSIAAWSEIASHWLETQPNLLRNEDGNYIQTNLNLLRFNAAPLADFEHLWMDKGVQRPASVLLKTSQWTIEFEVIYKETELAAIRPAKSVREDDLENYIKDPLRPIYIPPLSGLDLNEPLYDPLVIQARLAQSQAGSVLRNLLWEVSKNDYKWNLLNDVIQSFFGYELLSPSPSATILARYRHSSQGPSYDLSSAASGFLQVLMVYAALLHKDATVVLIDEPDAHLHVLLQDKMYHSLREHARQNRSQLIISTHSERIINVADIDNLRLLSGELRKINDKRKLTDTLYLENIDILLSETEPGILYVEGNTDMPILREWARVIEHPLLPFLEKPFALETAEHKWKAVKHFSAMRQMTPGLHGVELCDGDNRDHNDTPRLPDGLKRLYWDRYEIESYLLHPESLTRFIGSFVGKVALDRAKLYMKRQLPPALYDNPFESSPYLNGTKAKEVLAGIFNEAGLEFRDSEYYQIAKQMTKTEIHPEIIQKLDVIADYFDFPRTSLQVPIT